MAEQNQYVHVWLDISSQNRTLGSFGQQFQLGFTSEAAQLLCNGSPRPDKMMHTADRFERGKQWKDVESGFFQTPYIWTIFGLPIFCPDFKHCLFWDSIDSINTWLWLPTHSALWSFVFHHISPLPGMIGWWFYKLVFGIGWCSDALPSCKRSSPWSDGAVCSKAVCWALWQQWSSGGTSGDPMDFPKI